MSLLDLTRNLFNQGAKTVQKYNPILQAISNPVRSGMNYVANNPLGAVGNIPINTRNNGKLSLNQIIFKQAPTIAQGYGQALSGVNNPSIPKAYSNTLGRYIGNYGQNLVGVIPSSIDKTKKPMQKVGDLIASIGAYKAGVSGIPGQVTSLLGPLLSSGMQIGQNKLAGQPLRTNLGQAWDSGQKFGYQASTIAGGTNPILAAIMGKAGLPGAGLVARSGSSLANVGQGLLIDRASGMPTTKESVALDAILGFAGGPKQFGEPVVKNTIKGVKAYKDMTPAERQAGKVSLGAPINGVPTVKYADPQVRGDITKLEKALDDVLGTESFTTSNKWQAKQPARQTAKSQLEYYAENSDEAKQLLGYVNQLEDQIATLQVAGQRTRELKDQAEGVVARGKGFVTRQIGKTPKPPLPEHLRSIVDKQTPYSITDITPDGYGPGKGGIRTPQKLEKLPGETLDQAMARKVGYQVDNGLVNFIEGADGWKARIKGAEGLEVIGAKKKEDLIGLVYKRLYPDINQSQTPKPPTGTQSLDPMAVLDQKSTKPKELKTQLLRELQAPNTSMGGETYPVGQLANKTGKQITPPQESVSQPYFNTDRLNVSKKSKKLVDQTISEVKPQIEKLVGKTLSNKEAVQVANNTASVLDKTITRQETLAWEAKMLRARQLVAQQAQDGKVTQEYIDNLLAIKSQGTDIARKLQSLSIGADPTEITAKQAILESVLKVIQDTEAVLASARGVDFNNQQQATAFYRQFIQPKTSEWIDLLRYNSMLSSPNTHINNAFSNYQGTGIIAPIEKTLEGSIDAVRSAITGKPRTTFAGEGAQYAQGYYSNVRNATNKFVDVMRGKSFIKNPDTKYLPLATSGPKMVVEKILNLPMRLLEASDQFFTALTEGGLKQSLEYRFNKLGKTGNIDKMASDEASKRLFRSQLGVNEGSKVLDAIDLVANSVQKLKGSSNPIVSTIAKFTLPFLRTPTNILKQGVEYSPLGVSTLWGASNKQQQLARSLIGSSIALGTAMLVGGDRMTWAEPTNEKQRNAFRAAGLQPYSVKIGDKWVSYSKLHPALSFNMALVAGLRDAMAKKTLDDGQVETVLNGLAKWLNFYADQSYLKNIGDMVAATKGDTTGVVRFVSNYPTQLIPFRALMSWVNRIVDPVQRQIDAEGGLLEKQLQQVALQIPGLSGKVPIRLDSKGNPIENQNRFINAVSPLRITTENKDAKKIYDTMVTKSQNARDEDVIKEKVLNSGQEQTYQGKKYYLSKERDTKTGEYNPVVKSIKVPQSSSDIYENLPKKYETSDDSPKNILQKVAVYGSGIFKDPKGTLEAIKTGQPIRKVRGDAVVVERVKNLSSLDQGDKSTQVDHVIPIALGGDNSESNLAVISTQDNQAKGVVDTYLAKELQAGRITKKVAQERDLNWRQEIANLPAKDKTRAQSILAATPKAQTITSTNLPDIVNKEYQIKKVDADGTTSYSKVTIKIPEYPTMTGLTEVDKKLKSTYYGALTTAKNNAEKLYMAGEVTAGEFNDLLVSLNTKQKKAKTTKAKKPKKGAKITVKAPKISKIKLKTFKPIKIKVAKAPKFKAYKPKKLTVKFAKPKIQKIVIKKA